MMNRRTLAAGLGAAILAAPRAAFAQNKRLRIAISSDDAAAEPLYAQQLGYFKDARLDVDLQVLANGGEILSGLNAGAIDIGSANLLTVVAAFRKGVPLRIVAPASVYDGSVPQVALVVPSGSPIRTAKDLEGKTIATNPVRGISSISTDMWMKKNGADPSTIKWVEMPRGAMGPALQQGHIDAATVTEPFMTVNRATTRVLAAPYSAVSPHFLTVVFSSSTSWAQANPELVTAFAGVMRRTALWANANQAASAAILAQKSDIQPDLIRQMQRVKYEPLLTASDVQPCIDLAASAKLIDASFSAQDMLLHL
jgi:NitT/TauT family transport system substrate-binding protein